MTILARPDCAHTVAIGVPIDMGPHRAELLAAIGYAIETRPDGGPAFRLVTEDDGRAAAPARAAALRLLDAGVSFVIGHFSASAALAAAPIYERAGVAFFAPGTTHPDLTGRDRRLVFRVCGRDTDQAETLAVAIESLAGGEKPNPLVVAQPTPYGRSMGRLLCDRLKKLKPQHWECGPNDSSLPPVANEGVVAIAGAHDFIACVAIELRNRGHRGPLMASDDAYTDRLLTIAGDAVEGLRVPVLETAGSGDDADRLAQRFEREHGRRPGAFFLTSHVAANMILESSHRARSGDAEVVAASIRRRTWHTPFGRLSFGADGDVQGFRWSLRRVVNGGFVPDTCR